MSDLNIRAAKALGLRKSNDPDNYPYDTPFGLCYADELRFTTSYDWAWLGVAKCVGDFKLGTAFLSKFDCLMDIFSATPEQITQAWCEVLES